MTNIDLVHHAVVLWRCGGPGRRKQAAAHRGHLKSRKNPKFGRKIGNSIMKNLELVKTPLWNCPYTLCRAKRIGLILLTPNGKKSNDYCPNQNDLGDHVVTIAKLSTAFYMSSTLVVGGKICHMTLTLLIKLATDDCSNINVAGSGKKFLAT